MILDRFLSTVGEVILTSSQLRTTAGRGQNAPGGDWSAGLDRMDRVVGELQRRALELRTTPLQRIVEPLPRMAREIARQLGKSVEVEIVGAELELDRSILDRLSDPLVHLVRNAVDHGIESPEARVALGKRETGRVAIEARRDKDTIQISVRDDGAGLDLDAVRARAVKAGLVQAALADDLSSDQIAALVFSSGISTAATVSEISGRGVGMDAVRATIESLGGQVHLETTRGTGTVTTLAVPISAAVQRVLLAGFANETIAIPIAKVERILEVPADEIECSANEEFVLVDDEPIPVIPLQARLGLGESISNGASVMLVLAEVHGERVALRVGRIVGQQQIYVKPLPDLLSGIRALAGLTILGNGRPVFLVDLNKLT